MGQRRDGGDAAHAGNPLHRAHARRELSRLARQPGQLSRQHTTRNAAVYPRGERRGIGARLRPRHRQTARRRIARQRRADARDHGDFQCLVRSHSDAAAGRRRPGRRHEAPAVGRLDPRHQRHGRAGPSLHQMGQPARIGESRAGVHPARLADRSDAAARSRVRRTRCRPPGRSAGRPGADAGARPVSHANHGRAARRSRGRSRAMVAHCQTAALPDRPRQQRSLRLRAPRRAGRARRRACAHRHQDRSELSHPAPAASVPAEPLRQRRCNPGVARRRRDREPRLDRSRRDAAPGVRRRASRRQGRAVLAGSIRPPRLEHGLSDAAADRSDDAGSARSPGRGAPRQARPACRRRGQALVRQARRRCERS